MLKHRALLKSIISYTDDKKEMESLVENFIALNTSNLYFPLDLHKKIYIYICEHVKRSTVVPSNNLLKKHFEDDAEISEELQMISEEPSLYSSNFTGLISELYEEQMKSELNGLLNNVRKISESGLKVEREELYGPKDAAKYFLHNSVDFLKPASNVRTEGSLKGNSKEAVDRYFKIKTENKFKGLLTGLETIDFTCRGIKPGELWLIMAAPSELKTTTSMNFAYTQAIEAGKNVKFISLEMSYEQCHNMFVCIHSANYNLWHGSEWDDVWPLNYDDIDEGLLTPREEKFFKFLCNDLDTNSEYGYLDIHQPSEGLTVSHLKSYAEVENKKRPIDIIYLDYIELMKDEFRSNSYTEGLNARIKQLKQFALQFNGGAGVRLISAYQANREGKKLADKNDGVYRLDALSYANEAERSADVIIYTYLNDDLRDNKEVKMGCLKNRTKPKFKQFIAKTRLECRKIYEPMMNSENQNQGTDPNSIPSQPKKIDIREFI